MVPRKNCANKRGVPAGGSLLQHLLQPPDLDLGRHTVCRLPGARQVGHSFSNFMLQSPQYSWPHTEHIERFQAERAPADGGGGEGSCNPSIRHEKTLTSEHPQTVGVAAVTLTGSQRRPGSPPGPPGFAALQAPPLRLLLQLRLRERRHGLWDPARTAHLGGAGGGRQGCCGSVRGCPCQP